MAGPQAIYTREGYARLEHELEALKARRGELVNDIKEAREQGDLRENHAYHQAKDTQGMVEARIRELELRFADAVVLKDGELIEEVIVGVPVSVKMVDSGKVRTYTIVSPEELDEVEGGASQESPVGSALLGKKVGDIAEVQGPNGIVKIEVLSIGA